MGTFYRYSNLVTSKNQLLVLPGLDVVSQVDGQKYNFNVGQPILYDPFTNKTISIADLATAKAARFGVGHNPNRRSTLATEIRHMGGNYIDLCKSTLEIKVSAPACPTPFVLDFEFGCTFTGRDYMFDLAIDDWMTRAYFKEGAYGSLLYNLRTDVTGCTQCSEEENCNLLACQLAAKINGDYIKYFQGTSKLGLNTGMPGQGVWAAQKFTTTRTFTLAPSTVVDACGDPCAVKGLLSITATGLQPLVFTNVVDPANPTQTLVEQLSTVNSQINQYLNGSGAGYGSSYFKAVDCCNYELEVNTCLTGVTLTYYDNSTATFVDSNAFTSFAPANFCQGCTPPPNDVFACGVRIYVDPLELPCNCQYPDGNPPNTFVRTAKATAWGDGWQDTSWRSVIVSQGSIAVGTGYEVQQNELKQSNGGEGWDYAYGVSYSDDRIPLPLASSAYAQASVADCNDLYCIWSIVIEDHFAAAPHAHRVSNSQSVNFLNVPRGDDATIAQMEDLFTALADRGFCSSAEIECIPASS